MEEKKIPLGLKILLEEFNKRKDLDEYIHSKDLYPLLVIMIDLLNPENYKVF